MKKAKIVIKYLVSLLTLCLLVACSDHFQEPKVNIVDNGYGKIKISFADEGWQGRTVFPTKEFTSYKYFFTKLGVDGISRHEKTTTDGSFIMETGEWQVEVEAYSGNTHAASGTATFTLGSTVIENLTINLVPTNIASNGTFKYKIEYPVDANIITFKMVNLASSIEESGFNLNITNTANGVVSINGEKEIPVGSYLLTITLNENGKYAGKNEVIYIYGALTSEYNVKFVPEDFIGTIAITFAIDEIAERTFTGNEHRPEPTVRDGVTVLAEGTHYTVSYADNTNAGTASVVIEGIGIYTGSNGSRNFIINPIAPSVPQNLTVTSGNGQITLSWTAPSSNGGIPITGYLISWTPVTGTGTETSTGTSSTITGLNNGTQYTFIVHAINAFDKCEGTSITAVPVPLVLGAGTSSNPYQVFDEFTLRAVGRGNDNHAGFTGWTLFAYYRQTSDIDITDKSDWIPIGTSTNGFTGNYNGNNQKITGLTIDTTSNYQGMFGYVRGGRIENLELINVKITGGNYVGGIAATKNSSGQIRNVRLVNANINGVDYVGGVTGDNSSGLIENCYVSGSISGRNFIGGVTGSNYDTLRNSNTECSVSGNNDVGGLAGSNSSSSGNDYLQNCYSTGNVTGSMRVGGVVGRNLGIVQECYSAGTITGTHDVGGVVGHNTRSNLYYSTLGTVENCYSTGNISGLDSIGGVAGYNDRFIENCYAIGNITGGSSIGGIVGSNSYVTNNYGSIYNCYSTGFITSNSSAGGVAGSNGAGISYCYATGDINGNFAGGVAGYNFKSVSRCFSTSNVIADGNDSYAGGIIGYNQGGTVQDCYSTGNITSNGTGNYSSAGGIIGYAVGDIDNTRGSVTRCYALGSITGNGIGLYGNAGGIVGFTNEMSSVNDSVALNISISRSSGTSTRFGRVAGASFSTLSNNYGRSGMMVLGSSNVTSSASGVHGLNVNSGTNTGQYNNVTWWTWDLSNVWIWYSVDNLPKLRDTTGQNIMGQ